MPKGEERKEYVKKRLLQGDSMRQIAVDHGMNPQSFWEWCKRNGVNTVSSCRDGMGKEEVDRIEELYEEGLSMQEIGREVGVSVTTVWRKLQKRNVVTRGRLSALKKSPDLREDFFSSIDCEEKAYWLGMMYADGYVKKRSNGQCVVGLCLKESDGDHVFAFRDVLGSNVRVGKNKDGSRYVQITSCRLLRDLVRLGCVERKSYKELQVPDMPEDMVVHFWRGVFDGDGSLTFSGRDRCTLQLRVCGASKMLLEDFREWVRGRCLVSEKCLVRVSDAVWAVQLYAKNAESILDELYGGASVWLNRKREIYEKYKCAVQKVGVQSKKKYEGSFCIEQRTVDDVLPFIMEYHYSETMPVVTKEVLVAVEKGDVVGVMTLGWGMYPNHTVKKLFPSVNKDQYREIGRMCFHPEMGEGFGSRYIAAVKKWVKKNMPGVKVIFTWADGAYGKPGIVYQASSFLYGGFIWTYRYVSEDGRIIHPSATREWCEEESKLRGKTVYWLSPALQREKKVRLCRVKQFRYVCFVCGAREKNCLMRESTVEWNQEYPKYEDLEWRVQVKKGEYVSRKKLDFDRGDVWVK